MRIKARYEVAAARRARRREGLTLPEMAVAMAVFSMTVAGFVYCQMFGMRQDELTNSKIGASEQARMSFNDLGNDIRAAKIWQIGNGDIDGFSGVPSGTSQHGTALKLSMTTDTNSYYIYYFNTNEGTLLRGHSGSTSVRCLARFLTNTMYFQAKNYRGDLQTDLTHKGVINVMMQFWQYQYPITKIGPGYYYDFYQLELRVTPHTPDGP